jgi:hypothetical protein
MFSAIKICFLFSEIDDNGRPAGMALRNVGCDHVGHGAAAGERRSYNRERRESCKSICHGSNRATLEEATEHRT